MSEVFNSKDNEPSKDLDDKTENKAGNQLGKEAEEKIKEKPTGLFPTLKASISLEIGIAALVALTWRIHVRN
jgi:hypothetical protein